MSVLQPAHQRQTLESHDQGETCNEAGESAMTVHTLREDLKEIRVSAFQRIDSTEQRLIKLEKKVDQMDRESNVLNEAGDAELAKALRKIRKLRRRIEYLEMRK